MQWFLLEMELEFWRRAGRRPRLWWRDDDARAVTPPLERLLAISRQMGVPLTLAVIPSGDMEGLAERLAGAALIAVAQHGVDHQNRRAGPEAGEFPHAWPRARVGAALREGWARVSRLPGAVAVYAPPWNDVHPDLEAALTECGFSGWSAHGTLGGAGPTSGGLTRADAHLDLLRWRGGARFRGEGLFLDEFRRELARRRRMQAWDAPIGLLTHHLAHDEAAWRFLERFIGWSLEGRTCDWVDVRSLMTGASAPGTSARRLLSVA